MTNPYKEDYELEQEQEEALSGKKYGKANQWISFDASENSSFYPASEQIPLTRIEIQESDYLIKQLIQRISQLEEKIYNLQKQQIESEKNHLLLENEVSRNELEEIFDIDLIESSKVSIDGSLSEFVVENENSQELVRSVRDFN